VPLGHFANLTGAGATAEGPRCEAVSVEIAEDGVDMEGLTEMLLERSDRVTSLFITSVTSAAESQLAQELSSAIYSWLVLAIAVIMVGMLLGIANTSFLTVSQRLREIGTLRALGLSRDQVRKLVQPRNWASSWRQEGRSRSWWSGPPSPSSSRPWWAPRSPPGRPPP